ncbi:MAG: ribosome biogenesis GTPase Der, partial [Gammaproteobacteria bacterium]|nr:ribosome biogenesis GTPase Der [Gammaproteobacteria bacterium]
AFRQFNTKELTDLLEEAVFKHNPPLHQGRRIKLRYAHQGGKNPPIIVIHGSKVDKLNDAYKRYLMSFYINRLKLKGTPVRIEFRSGENPYAGKRNKLSRRQQEKKKRLMKHVKKKK